MDPFSGFATIFVILLIASDIIRRKERMKRFNQQRYANGLAPVGKKAFREIERECGYYKGK